MDPLEAAEKAEEAGDLDGALLLWRDLAEARKDPAFFCHYGRVAEKLERWTEAQSAFDAALGIDPDFSLAIESMGDLWFTRTDAGEVESFQMAEQWFLRAIRCERNARVLTFLGATYTELGKVAEARTAFEEAIEMDPLYEEALYNLAKLEKESDARKAIDLLEKAIEIDPNYALAHQELGKLYEHAGELTRAEYHFRRSLEADPTDYWSHLFLANLFAVQGKSLEAERMYRFATSVHPEIRAGVEFFARFLISIGRSEEAASMRANLSPSGH